MYPFPFSAKIMSSYCLIRITYSLKSSKEVDNDCQPLFFHTSRISPIFENLSQRFSTNSSLDKAFNSSNDD